MEKINLTLLLGTNRNGRQSEHVYNYLKKLLEKRENINLRLVDVRDFDLPQNEYGRDIKEQFSDFSNTIETSDAIIIVAPEYNHSFPGRLKSVLDLLLKEYRKKAVGIASVSSGMWGGIRGIENLAPMLRLLGLWLIRKDLNFPNVAKLFDESGQMKPEMEELYEGLFEEFMTELEWSARALKWGRENL